MRLFSFLVALFALSCSSESGPPLTCDAGAPVCSPATAAGNPCASDIDCVGATECEHPRCNYDTGRCIVTAGLEDGQPCSGGVCKDRMCCQ